MLTLDKPVEDRTDDAEKVAHYFLKRDMDRALFEAVEVPALCGKRMRPLGSVAGVPVCPKCRERYERIPG